MAKAFEVHIPIYKEYLYVLVGTPKESVEALMEKYDLGDKNAETLIEHLNKHSKNSVGIFTYNEESKTYTIWLQQEPDTIAWEGVLLHEINHAVFYMLDNLGLEHTQASDEAYSYLSEYLYVEIMTKFEESDEESISDN
jgi:hypothetical protein